MADADSMLADVFSVMALLQRGFMRAYHGLWQCAWVAHV